MTFESVPQYVHIEKMLPKKNADSTVFLFTSSAKSNDNNNTNKIFSILTQSFSALCVLFLKEKKKTNENELWILC